MTPSTISPALPSSLSLTLPSSLSLLASAPRLLAATSSPAAHHISPPPGTSGRIRATSAPRHCTPHLEPGSGVTITPPHPPSQTQDDTHEAINVTSPDMYKDKIVSDTAPPPSQGQDYVNHMLAIYQAVKSTGKVNHLAARIPLPSNLNIPAWRRLTEGHADQLLIDLLAYGFPLGFVGPPPTPCYHNHPSATCFPDDVASYITEECGHGALIGPFSDLPFTWAQISPLMSRPKLGSDKRRIITDLSYPEHASVNYFTPKDTYCGLPLKMTLPSIDDIRRLVIEAGPQCFMFTCDISRAFRQFRTDPLSWPLTCIQFGGQVYCDVSEPFGSRWSSSACQRATDAVRFIMHKAGHTIVNYIDDLIGIAHSYTEAQAGLATLQSTLAALGLPENMKKTQHPSRSVKVLGTLFCLDSGTIQVPGDKLEDIITTVRQWQHKSSATKKQLQSLLGRLLHIAQCIKPARLFLNRMLQTLREHHDATRSFPLTSDFKKDLNWFMDYASACNGVFLIHPTPLPEQEIYADACLTGAGAIYRDQCYHTTFPPSTLEGDPIICHLEAINVLVSIKLWARELSNSTAIVYCDNAVTIYTLTNARGTDLQLLSVAREVWLICANNNIDLLPLHKPGSEMEGGADALSRHHLGGPYPAMVKRLVADKGLSVRHVDPYLFKLQSNL